MYHVHLNRWYPPLRLHRVTIQQFRATEEFPITGTPIFHSKTDIGLLTVVVSVLLVSISEIIKLFLNDYLDLGMHMAAIKAKRPAL
jgi:hypothetical protein